MAHVTVISEYHYAQQIASGHHRLTSDEPLELGAFHVQMFPARGGDRVEARAAVVLGLRPLGHDPAALLESLKGGVERAVVDEDIVARRSLDRPGDALAVHARAGEGSQDEQVERALQEGVPVLGRHSS